MSAGPDRESPEARRRIAALNRAFRKAQRLAPPGTVSS